MKWVWRIWENSLMINKRKNSFRNCIIFTRTEEEKKRKEIFQIVNSCFCVVYFVLIQFISFLKKFLTYVNYIQEKIIQKSWDLVKWLWRDFKIQISIILCIITPRIITQKHSRSQKWRSCHFGPGFANLFEGTVFKESKDCWVATMYYTNQSTEKIIGLSDRTGNLEVWIPPPCVLLLKYSGLLFFMIYERRIIFSILQLWD